MAGKPIGNRPEFLSLKPKERKSHPYFNAVLDRRRQAIEDAAVKVMQEGKGGSTLATREELVRIGTEKFKALLGKNWFVIRGTDVQMKYVMQAMRVHNARKIGRKFTVYPQTVFEHFAKPAPREFSQEVFNLLKQRTLNGLAKQAMQEPAFKHYQLEPEHAEYAALQALKEAVQHAPSFETANYHARLVLNEKLEHLAEELLQSSQAEKGNAGKKRQRRPPPKYQK